MIGQNPKKSNAKKLHFFISYVVMLGYICAKEIYNASYSLKNANILRK
jgi:hypothetical protein